ncbi:hypothetical protein LTR56_014693 [Elasticomyces elasticus]|nr:hypothetical protein LTR56_014693 [Elasticomyces elasticus]KAK3636812.1 hypothetical protein LTR22_018565 [Elasticomyces elasticus]KAK4912516.1 hypothetical protein LTR49_019060 [Elasticomyces elasticus]KAK5751882.1 hypothetical protein LTS12_018060 [Elasticomyces elasticus]
MAAPIANIALNPLLTAPLWLALTAPQTRNEVIQHLGKYVSQTTIERATGTLKWLAILEAARLGSRLFSELAQNNFRFSSEAHRYDWPKEIALVTGGAGGFGSLMCKSLAEQGLTVCCVNRVDVLPPHMKHANIHYFKCDITNNDAVQQLAKDIQDKFGRHPSILVNNAGVAFDHIITTATPAQLRTIFDVNVNSHYYLIQAFVPAMIADKKGHVVSLASMASFLSGPGLAPYAGTKAAVLALHEGLQQECRAIYNAPEIKFTIVHPTFAATPIIKAHEEQLRKDGARILAPEVVSDAVVKQILSCKGKQLIVAGDMGWIAGVRGFPQWLQQIMFRFADAPNRRDFARKKWTALLLFHLFVSARGIPATDGLFVLVIEGNGRRTPAQGLIHRLARWVLKEGIADEQDVGNNSSSNPMHDSETDGYAADSDSDKDGENTSMPPVRRSSRYGPRPSFLPPLDTISDASSSQETSPTSDVPAPIGRQFRQDSYEPVSPMTKTRSLRFAEDLVTSRYQPPGDIAAMSRGNGSGPGEEAVGLFGFGI